MRQWLKNIREKNGLTQNQVAEAAGMSRQFYSMIENGERGGKLPVQTSKKIADALGFDWTLFYQDETQPQKVS